MSSPPDTQRTTKSLHENYPLPFMALLLEQSFLTTLCSNPWTKAITRMKNALFEAMCTMCKFWHAWLKWRSFSFAQQLRGCWASAIRVPVVDFGGKIPHEHLKWHLSTECIIRWHKRHANMSTELSFASHSWCQVGRVEVKRRQVNGIHGCSGKIVSSRWCRIDEFSGQQL